MSLRKLRKTYEWHGYRGKLINGKFQCARYTEELQSLLGLRTKPEPWLHIVFVPKYSLYYDRLTEDGVSAAVYVWDTREIVETISTYPLDKSIIGRISSYSQWNKLVDICNRNKVRDSHTQLVSSKHKFHVDAWD